MNTAKHTPTPWGFDPQRPNKIIDDDGEFVTFVSLSRYQDDRRDKIGEANAAFIVRAVNAHDELVAALETARAMLKERDVTRVDVRLRQIDAALAKVGAA